MSEKLTTGMRTFAAIKARRHAEAKGKCCFAASLAEVAADANSGIPIFNFEDFSRSIGEEKDKSIHPTQIVRTAQRGARRLGLDIDKVVANQSLLEINTIPNDFDRTKIKQIDGGTHFLKKPRIIIYSKRNHKNQMALHAESDTITLSSNIHRELMNEGWEAQMAISFKKWIRKPKR